MKPETHKFIDCRRCTSPIRKFLSNALSVFILDKDRRNIFRERFRLGVSKMRIATVDFVVSAGNGCAMANYTRLLELRKFSSPMDWMIYDVGTWFAALENDGKNFFSEWETAEAPWIIRDVKNGIYAPHEFSATEPIESLFPVFRERMVKRATRLRKRIESARKVGIAMRRDDSREAIIAFAEKLSAMFPNQRFLIVNGRHDPDAPVDAEDYSKIGDGVKARDEKWIFAEVSFFDRAEDPKRGNADDWRGNQKIWPKVLKDFFSDETLWKK